jgi:hypothetical protein
VHAGPGDEAEAHVGAAVAALRIGGLDAELMRVGPGGPTGGALVMREPGEEPGVRAVLVVDLERDEQASAEHNGGQALWHGEAR